MSNMPNAKCQMLKMPKMSNMKCQMSTMSKIVKMSDVKHQMSKMSKKQTSNANDVKHVK